MPEAGVAGGGKPWSRSGIEVVVNLSQVYSYTGYRDLWIVVNSYYAVTIVNSSLESELCKFEFAMEEVLLVLEEGRGTERFP